MKEVKVTRSCQTLCDPLDYTVQGILQARILEWVSFPFSRGSSQPRDRTQICHTADGFFTCWATREAQDRRIDTCVSMAESLYCPPETLTVLLLAILQYKTKVFLKCKTQDISLREELVIWLGKRDTLPKWQAVLSENTPVACFLETRNTFRISTGGLGAQTTPLKPISDSNHA